jgi:predicted ribosome quality control (RQC) complex YloA/Tae2 family protein
MITQTYTDQNTEVEYTIFIGKNSQENWDIIDKANQRDIWFHLGGGLPSPHVILKLDTPEKVSKTLIKHCALLCKQNSKMYNVRKVNVIYTEIKNVKKADKVGSVYTSNIKTLQI